MSALTYDVLHQCLIEAEDRVKNFPDAGVRQRSQETVDLCLERLAREGLTRENLEALAELDRTPTELPLGAIHATLELAERLAGDPKVDTRIRKRAQEGADRCMQQLKQEGITRQQLGRWIAALACIKGGDE